MKTSLFKSPQAHKWGLFCLLAGALACDLSLNPQTRHYSADFASTTTANGQVQSVKVAAGSDTYDVTVVQEGKETKAFFDRTSTTEASGVCQLCGHPQILTSSITDVTQLTAEITEIATKAQTKKDVAVADDDDSDDAPAKAEKPGSVTKVSPEFIKAWAAKCDKKSKDDKLECQEDRLIKLSAYMEDDEAQQKVILNYFKKYVLKSMSRKLSNSMTYNGTRIDEGDQSDLEDQAATMLDGLQSSNGKSTRDAIANMLANQYSDQLKNAQNLIRNGQARGNTQSGMMDIYKGMNAIDYWGNHLNGEMKGITSQVDDSDAQASLESNFETPVSQLLSSMQQAAQQSLSRSTQLATLPGGGVSPCQGVCQAYANFNLNTAIGNSAMGMAGDIADASGLNTRGNQRGSSISGATWINTNQFSNQQQQCAIGNVHSANGTCVPQASIPGSYQQPGVINQPYTQNYAQPYQQQPGVMPGTIQQSGMIPQSGNQTGVLSTTSGRGRF